ncbi:hypothetical protein ABF87_13130 [Nitrosomonas sp. JL21]|uniref:hypothetical protein n=1 Tax=Nitrosomonas sp. JL21 TaxID=153949 RepID=UPI001372256D|nr:hypothetical protein [Nitrosomonas sp. JL21]MBL8497662.1 hypothetical protein [Nitrosomonas sp.]MCC7091392.1 hypothetical protein [Nitrosomonas sp.]MXS78879.1 hypothetical protein [Nitrosomonas sp. JL21]
MKITIVLFLIFCISSISHAGGTLKVEQAIIQGKAIKVGEGADIVQSRIKADQFVSSGYSYGDTSKGYYKDADTTYIITYGPPKDGIGAYIVRQIEKVAGKQEKTVTSSPQPSKSISKAGQSVTIGTLADTVLERRGKAISVKQAGRDENGLLVEWQYQDATYLMGRRLQGGIEAYRVIKITPQ